MMESIKKTFIKRVCFLLVLITAVTIQGLYAQYGFEVERDEKTGGTMFVGKCLFDDLSDEASFDWFTQEEQAYQPDETITEALKKKLPNCQILIFMGTWCGDTRDLLPKLYKTMQLSRSYTNYKMYALDRTKIGRNNEQAPYKIEYLPTIIVLKDGKELGRIVEEAPESIEKSLLDIVSGAE